MLVRLLIGSDNERKLTACATLMKRSAQCNRVENDDTLAYCRADGADLISDSSSVLKLEEEVIRSS